TPGTDDGNGGVENAYASGVRQGVRVNRGQLIGWVGDSGNAESIGSHLHFEIYNGGTAINPYESLLAAQNASDHEPEPEVLGETSIDLDYDIGTEQAQAQSINEDMDLPLASGKTFCESNSLIRTQELPAVYYCGRDGNRYVFQNESTFFSWYDDFNDVQFISIEDMGQISLKGSVTYKPGSYMVKLMSIPKVYAVAQGGTLRWVQTEEMAISLYGSNWADDVRDLPDSFFPAYTMGSEITAQ
ncbi:MAG: M23 family metallopeptidase, partial [Patescibacteria group bacterium]